MSMGCVRLEKDERMLFSYRRSGENSWKDREDILRPEDIMTLALSRSAGRKCVTDEMEYQVILNQADTEEEKHGNALAEDIEKEAVREVYIREEWKSQGQISKVHVTSDLIPLEERW